MGEPLDLLAQPVGVKLFYGIHDARVDVAAALAEHPAVGDVVGEGVLEGILQVRKELCRIKKFGILQIAEQAAEVVVRQPGNCTQKGQWDVVSNDRRLLQQALLGGGQRVDTRGEHRLHRGRDLDARERPRKAVVAARALEHANRPALARSLRRRTDSRWRAPSRSSLRVGEIRVGAQQSLKEFPKALAGKGIQT